MGADLIRYDLLVQDALRSVVRKVLGDAARDGLRGEHHFNISFKTHAAGVTLPATIKQRYPDEMAIILQHEFWDLTVAPEHFEVSLNFSRKPERLIIPFDAITGFSDPSVPFGFKLEPRGSETGKPLAPPAAAAKPAALRSEPAAKIVESKPAEAEAAKVVSIDAFRKEIAMAEIVNLRQARKRRARDAAEFQASEMRARFGRPKAERLAEAERQALAARALDGHRRDAPDER